MREVIGESCFQYYSSSHHIKGGANGFSTRAVSFNLPSRLLIRGKLFSETFPVPLHVTSSISPVITSALTSRLNLRRDVAILVQISANARNVKSDNDVSKSR